MLLGDEPLRKADIQLPQGSMPERFFVLTELLISKVNKLKLFVRKREKTACRFLSLFMCITM